jgi:hypothetical protein
VKFILVGNRQDQSSLRLHQGHHAFTLLLHTGSGVTLACRLQSYCNRCINTPKQISYHHVDLQLTCNTQRIFMKTATTTRGRRF